MKVPDSNKTTGLPLRSNDHSRTIRMRLLLKYKKTQWGKKYRATIVSGLSGSLLAGISIGIAIFLITVGLVAYQIFNNLPEIHQLQAMAGPEGSLYTPTRFYDRTGQQLMISEQTSSSAKEYISLSTYDDNQITTILAVFAEALLNQKQAGLDTQVKASADTAQPATIAERLVTDLLLASETPSFSRTMRMRLLALQASNSYGKQTLLEWFLNTASFGHKTYGASSAAQLYFNKKVNQLNTGEALILAVILQDPSVNPLDNPASFRLALQSNGSFLLARKLINPEGLDQASKAVVEIKPPVDIPAKGNPAFDLYVHEQLSEVLGNAAIERGGLSITTTMNAELQTRLECMVKKMLNPENLPPACNPVLANFSLPTQAVNVPAGLQINFVVLDPASGQVLAMLGDYSVKNGQMDYLNAHPGGSLLTPFIYLAGMLRGMGPASLVWDTPTHLDETLIEKYSPTYEFQGPMRARVALSEDHLTPATKLIDNLGEDNVIELMKSFGIRLYATEGMPYDSGITDSLAIAQAFGIFANNGNKAGQASQLKTGTLKPTSVLTVEGGAGEVLIDWSKPEQQAVISPALAFLMNDMLVSGGEGNTLYRGSTKQGITSSGMDYWRVVYNPDYVLVVWMGYADSVGESPIKELGIDTVLINVLEDYFLGTSQFENWQPPSDVTRLRVCDPSGQLPGDICPQTVMEYFLAGNEPTTVDTLHVRLSIDSETGNLATIFGDPLRIEQKVFFNPPPEEVAWMRAAGYLLPPDTYSIYQPGYPSGKTVIDSPQNFTKVVGTLDIKGRITPEGFISYRLDIGSGLAPAQWLQVGDTRTDLPSENPLGVLNTTNYKNGLYTIRLQVIREGNLVDYGYAVILIDNPA